MPQNTSPHDLLIATSPRSGSEWLCKWLLTSGAVGWTGEWLLMGRLPEVLKTLELQPGCSMSSIIAKLRHFRDFKTDAVSIKIMWNDFSLANHRAEQEGFQNGFIGALNNPRVVYLERRNKLAQAVSLFKARSSGKWSSAKGKTEDTEFSSSGIAFAYLGALSQNQSWKCYFKANSISPIHIYYEDFLQNPRAAIKKIFEALDVDPAVADRTEDPQKVSIQRTRNNEELMRQFVEARPDLVSPKDLENI